MRKLEWINFMHSEYCFFYAASLGENSVCKMSQFEYFCPLVNSFLFFSISQLFTDGYDYFHCTISQLSVRFAFIFFKPLFSSWFVGFHCKLTILKSFFFIGNFCNRIILFLSNRWHFIIVNILFGSESNVMRNVKKHIPRLMKTQQDFFVIQ